MSYQDNASASLRKGAQLLKHLSDISRRKHSRWLIEDQQLCVVGKRANDFELLPFRVRELRHLLVRIETQPCPTSDTVHLPDDCALPVNAAAAKRNILRNSHRRDQ